MKAISALVVVLALLLAVWNGCLAQENMDEATWTTKIQDLADSRIGVVTGGLQAIMLPKMLPEAELMEFNAITEAAMALTLGKIDAFSTDESTYLAMRREGQPFKRIDEPFMISEYGVLFGGGYESKLLKEFNAFLAEGLEDGTLIALQEKWFGEKEPTELLSVDTLKGENGSILFATSAGQKPYSFVKDGSYVGYDIEMAILFAQRHGYRLEIVDTAFSGMLLGVEQGKYDMAAAGVTITEERRAAMAMSDPYYEEDVVMVVLENSAAADQGFSFKENFEKTFIRESRWKLIVQGLGNTLLISVCAVLGGTAFGFALYMLARSGYRAVSAVTRTVCRAYTRLIAGTPTLVVLMILFYVVFGKTDIRGIWVAVLGFGLTFGSFVYEHLALCVEGIDRGQTEAAYALGYSRSETFMKIILPQSMKAFLPTYTGEVVGLIKATSVVGYIAVSDLTKMGDIIRSNTYEALFPLIAVAVIYFVITWGAAALLGLVQKKLDNHRRKNKNILKGVVR